MLETGWRQKYLELRNARDDALIVIRPCGCAQGELTTDFTYLRRPYAI